MSINMDESSFIAPYGTSYRLPIYGVLGLLLVVGLWRLLFPHTLRGIPGPRGGPVVGIGLAQPSLKSLRNWTLQYGELYTFRLGWYNWVRQCHTASETAARNLMVPLRWS